MKWKIFWSTTKKQKTQKVIGNLKEMVQIF